MSVPNKQNNVKFREHEVHKITLTSGTMTDELREEYRSQELQDLGIRHYYAYLALTCHNKCISTIA